MFTSLSGIEENSSAARPRRPRLCRAQDCDFIAACACPTSWLPCLRACPACLPARPAGDQEVLSLEEYRGVGKLKGKASGGSRTLRQLISAGPSLRHPPPF
jgi:hypothetical protein